MTVVTNESKNAMQRILDAMNGQSESLVPTKKEIAEANDSLADLSSPGQPSAQAIDAMAQVLNRLNNVTSQVLTESEFNPQLKEAINTKRIDNSVKVGSYEININEDNQRIAGKQYYSIYHTQSGDVIADDITLYEVALTVVKQLNNGKYVNSSIVRRLFEMDDKYTSQRISTVQYKRRAMSFIKKGDVDKSEIFESRYQSSIRNLGATKQEIKKLIAESKRV